MSLLEKVGDRSAKKALASSTLAPGIENVRNRRREIQGEIERLKGLEASYAALEFCDIRSRPMPSCGQSGWYEVVTINRFPFEVRITGSNVNVLPRRLFLATGLSLKLLRPSKMVLEDYSGSILTNSVGVVETVSVANDKSLVLEWEVLETGLFAMLGADATAWFGFACHFDREKEVPPHPTRGAVPELSDGTQIVMIPTLTGYPKSSLDPEPEMTEWADIGHTQQASGGRKKRRNRRRNKKSGQTEDLVEVTGLEKL